MANHCCYRKQASERFRELLFTIIAELTIVPQNLDVTTFLSRSLAASLYELTKGPRLDQWPHTVTSLAQVSVQGHIPLAGAETILRQIAKALSFIDHPLLAAYADSLFELFGDKNMSWFAAKAIGELGGPDTTLTKKNHAVIKAGRGSHSFDLPLISPPQVLHTQKYVNLVLPRLIEGALTGGEYCVLVVIVRPSCFALSESQQQTACLVALATLLDCVPKATYTPWISSV
jgi:RNAPII transcription regulator C-terminal